ncbi:MAG TPA: RagB/SusD family nutrient uptake outer membrane protein [Chitinophagaceae bacterium]|nr:RagB/SusD family nutrient uptake outer membrane protein [Chitinophagaceae bacterium]
MRQNIFKAGLIVGLVAMLAACDKKLDRLPKNDITDDQVYATPAGYQQAFAKVYASYALTGNSGPAGNGDVQGIDEGTSDFLRMFWWVQEVSTDEAVVQAGWNDPGIHNFHPMNWSSDNVIIKGVYYRSFYQITLANDFIRQASDARLAERGITGADAAKIKAYVEEARFLRAFQYWVLMDLFGKPAFVTENDAPLGTFVPQQTSREDLFAYIESELKDLENKLAAPRTNEYGRADRAAAWALLARMYLNAQVYTGTPKYTEAITYAKKVIDAGYSLTPDYRHLMLADNHTNTSEFILTINYDGKRTQNYGGTTFLVNASVGGSMVGSESGLGGGGWGGIRTTSALPNLFPDVTGTADKRAQFHTDGQSLELSADPAPAFTEGYAIKKYRNLTKGGVMGSDPLFTDIDFPLFRLAEQYLIYAEAVLRGGSGGSTAEAVNYINLIRTRAYGNGSGNINAGTLNLDFIIDERARELYWECFRRTDLIRYGRFTEGTYLWPWKGGVSSGTAMPAHLKVFPIPAAEITSNTNLQQNDDY